MKNNDQFTPGPWSVERPYGEPGVYISGPNTGLIAKIWPADPGYADDAANARMIAAAPEMLSALRLAAELIETARKHFPKSIKHADTFTLENVNATIGKAINRATNPEA